MTDERISLKGILRPHVLSVNGVVALVGLAAIGVAFFMDSIVVRIVCGLMCCGGRRLFLLAVAVGKRTAGRRCARGRG